MLRVSGILLYIPLFIFHICFSLTNLYGNLPRDVSVLRYNLVEGLPDIYIDQISEKIGRTWMKGYVWDKDLIHKFYSLLPKNDFFVVLDLGAQTGSFSLLSKYFPNSKWYAIEPIKEASDALKNNLILNNISNVLVYQKAAMDFSGKVKLKMPAMDLWGLATIGDSPQRFDTVMEREVECVDLDSFVNSQNIKKVHFMKLDTEGAELYILRGAKNLIMRDHPVILMEYNEMNMKQCSVSKKEIDDFLKEMGYEWKFVSHEDILCFPIPQSRFFEEIKFFLSTGSFSASIM